MRRLPLYKSRDVTGTKLRQSDGSVAEVVLEKLADERNVVDDRCFCQAAHLPQVKLVRLRAPFHRGESASCDLLGGYRALAAQKGEQVAKCGGIALGWAHPPRTISQIPRWMFRGDATQRDSLAVSAIG